MIKVLFISQWYPNRLDKMYGLFVQKHAEAVSLYCDVKVLYVQADESIESFEMIINKKNRITEVIVYYPCRKTSFFYKAYKIKNYLKAYWKGYKEILVDDFIPDIVHVNILTRTGFIAYIIKLLKGIPYIITEHWSRYLPTRNSYKGYLRKFITRIVVKRAAAVLPVSESLKKAMLNHNLKNDNYYVVNNVVDICFFTDSITVHRNKKRIIHISCFDNEAKNVSGIVRVARKLSNIRQDFELILIGTGIDFEKTVAYSQTLNFHPGIIHFLGEKTSEEVSNWINNSDIFVLFSNYENSPVVISESLACGKPVISSNVGGISEHVNETNGMLVEAGNEAELLQKIDLMLNQFNKYDSERIKKEAKNKFSYESVGLQITEIYKNCIK